MEDNLKRHKRFFLIGIGGAGMSAVAIILKGLGLYVCGSDLKESRYTNLLKSEEIEVFIGHSSNNIKNIDAVVYSTAISDLNEELMASRSKKIPVYTRGEVLSWLLNSRKGIAVTGTHGKTTTTSMISLIFRGLGLDPTIVIGGELNELGSNARFGRGQYLIAEACESDGTFLKYRPLAGVVTNIEDDHMDYWKDFSLLKKSFIEFLGNIKPDGFAVICGDDQFPGAEPDLVNKRIIKFGTGKNNDVIASNIVLSNYSSEFELKIRKKENNAFQKFTAKLNVPGIYNVKNSLAAFSVCYGLDLDIGKAVAILGYFTGAKRRFEKRGEKKGAVIFDDYAHHPTEVKATIEAAAVDRRKGRIITVFQPHRYTRLLNLHEKFSKSFDKTDILIVSDVFGSGETPVPGVSGKLLVDSLAENGFKKRLAYIPKLPEISEYLNNNIRKDDVVLIMGAGDITRVTEDLLRS